MSQTRVDAFLEVVRNPEGAPLDGATDQDDAIRSLLVHLIYADGDLADEELLLGLRMLPLLSPREAAARLRAIRGSPVDIAQLLAAVPDPEDRRKLIQFAQHVATIDGEYAEAEHEAIVALRREVYRASS
ncbi:MAG: TerB family tellurite resistance protein [Myxococcales bacterium]|nr:TerB family tellurite resistance protein [Myxococcales bacterium]